MKKCLFLVVAFLSLSLSGRAQAPAQPKEYTAHVTGYAHIDMAWLWRWEESIYDIMYNTFKNQLELMDQHPEFTFAQDGPDLRVTAKYQVVVPHWFTSKTTTLRFKPTASTPIVDKRL